MEYYQVMYENNEMTFCLRFIIQNGVVISSEQIQPDKLDLNNMVQINHENSYPSFLCNYICYIKKEEFSYEYFIENPKDLAFIDIKFNTKLFTDEQLKCLKFLKKQVVF